MTYKDAMKKRACELFDLGWTIPDVAEAAGLAFGVAEKICHNYLREHEDEKAPFRALMFRDLGRLRKRSPKDHPAVVF